MNHLKELGRALKYYRELSGKTIDQISKELSIDRSYFSKLEHGREKPSKETLDKLIKAYAIQDQGVSDHLRKLWGFPLVAGNTSGKEDKTMDNKQLTESPKVPGLQVAIPADKPILYTDSVFVTASPFGIVMDVAQSMGSSNQQSVVARIGMSKDHAKALLKVLQEKLAESEKPAKRI